MGPASQLNDGFPNTYLTRSKWLEARDSVDEEIPEKLTHTSLLLTSRPESSSLTTQRQARHRAVKAIDSHKRIIIGLSICCATWVLQCNVPKNPRSFNNARRIPRWNLTVIDFVHHKDESSEDNTSSRSCVHTLLRPHEVILS